MSDTKTAYGVCTEISETNGWTKFHIDVGSQWPLKLATKKTEIIEAGRAAGQQTPAAWTYTERESKNVNQHTGQPFTDRFLEGVAPTDESGWTPPPETSENVRETAVASLAQASRNAPLLGGDKDRAITRMACLKAAAETVGGVAFDDPEADVALEVMKIAQRYEQWVYRDLAPPPAALQ